MRTKFVRSKLGGLWMILNPLAQVLIFAFVLSAVLSAKLPGIENRYAYAIYLMAGTLGWSLFSEIMGRCVTMFVDNANILKKLAFPRVALPCIVVGSAIVNNVLLFLAVLLIFGFFGHVSGLALVALPVVMVVTISLALGVGLMLGVLNVFIRDIGQAGFQVELQGDPLPRVRASSSENSTSRVLRLTRRGSRHCLRAKVSSC